MARHPYYPTKLRLEGYHPMVLSMDYILAVFAGGAAAVAAGTWFLSGKDGQSCHCDGSQLAIGNMD